MNDENGFLQRPWSRVIIILGAAFFIYAIAAYYHHVAWDIVLEEIVTCVGGLVIWVFFFAQFILPVRKLRDRMSIAERLWLYIGEELSRKTLARHGPALFIENGVISFREGELEERGAGVIWLDSASAVLLRKKTAYTRVEGPGVVFTKNGEYIAATMDLHPSNETLGPVSSPFAVKPDDEKFKEFDEKRWQTSAMTRDGIEIVAQIGVKYQLNVVKSDSNSKFGFDREAAYAYLTRNILPDHKVEKPLTSNLPGKLMVDMWREYLRKYTFNELCGYPTGTAKPGEIQPKFQVISGYINDRLNKDEVDFVDDYGNKQDRKVPSLEARQLKEMGLKANFTLKGWYMPVQIENDLIEKFKANWLLMANKQSELIDQEVVIRTELGKADAQREFGLQAAKVLARHADSILGQNYQHKRSHIVELIVQGHYAGIVQKPELQKRLTGEARTLSDIITWLRERRREDQHGG